MRPWQLGNTTVRSPFRLRDGLLALHESTLEGKLHGSTQEKALRKLLGDKNIVSLGEDKTYSVGRKWRSALSKMGFITPDLSRFKNVEQVWVGAPDFITENGCRLIESESVSAWQECYLRALAAYYIPSVSEPTYSKDYVIFSPLRHVLNILLALEERTGSSRLNFIEMALVVQFTSPANSTSKIIDNVLALRQRQLTAPHKRVFETAEYNAAAKKHGHKTGHTYKDYADLNFRYLKATGLVLAKGKGITLAPEKHVLVSELVLDSALPMDVKSQLIALCKGAELPTDRKDPALLVLKDLVRQLAEKGKSFDLSKYKLDNAKSIGVARHEAEQRLSMLNELDYAKQQVNEWEEISAYLGLFANKQLKGTMPNGVEIAIPKSEAPAYFEWVMWRAFLAINKLVNPPYEARRFKIDQDFLPVAPAPGGGSDVVLEFDDFILGVEVTLTESSRQEAAEGESVRRHIAQLLETNSKDKAVYGLFSARKIDTNTTETFRSGTWYGTSGTKMKLDILPITVAQFQQFFIALFVNAKVDNVEVRNLIDQCVKKRDQLEAPSWKRDIEQTITHRIAGLDSKSSHQREVKS